MSNRTRPGRGRAIRGSRPRLVSGGRDREALDHFFAEIRDTPVLTAEQEQELGKTMREARTGLRDALGRIPGCARRLVAAWDRREADGRVMSRLSERAGEKGLDVDTKKSIAKLRKLLDDAAAKDERAPGREALERKLVLAFGSFDPQTALLLDWVEELRQNARRSAAQLRKTEGTGVAEMRPILRSANAHRERYLEARSTFVLHNLRFVVHMAKDFRHLDLPFADLIQEGSMGLIRAVEKFDERKGFRFSTYASWWIYQAFIRSVQRDSRTVRLPSNIYDRFLQLRKAEEELHAKWGRPPTTSELAEHLSEEADVVEDLLAARAPALSFDAPLRDADDRSVGETLSDPETAEPGEGLDAAALSTQIGSLMRRLPERERRIVQARFGLGRTEPLTLQSLADELGMSRERVRQLEKRALERMEAAARDRGLGEFLETGTG